MDENEPLVRKGASGDVRRGGDGACAAARLPQPAHWKLVDYYRERIGALVDQMVQERSVAERSLRGVDPFVRMAALHVVSAYWCSGAGEDATIVCEELALSDPSSDVRGGAGGPRKLFLEHRRSEDR